MPPIKQTMRYHEMADPQTQPRFSGVPTFFRVPYEHDLTAVDIGVIGAFYRQVVSAYRDARRCHAVRGVVRVGHS